MSDFITIDRDSEEWRVITSAIRVVEYEYYSYGLPYPSKLVRTMKRLGLNSFQEALDAGAESI